MCQCVGVKREDVLYRMGGGNRMNPYHKVCGEDLSEEQRRHIDLEQRRRWGGVRQ